MRQLKLRVQVLGRSFLFALVQVGARWKKIVHDLHLLREVATRPLLVPAPDDPRIKPEWRGLYFHREGKAGQTLTVQAPPGFLFMGRRLIATDTSEVPGTKTKIMGCFVGNKPQMIIFNGGVLSQVFDREAVGSEIDFDTCEPMLFVTFQVMFLVDCAWTAELWGDWKTWQEERPLPVIMTTLVRQIEQEDTVSS